MQWTENPCVPGSIPGPGTNNLKRLSLFGLTAFFVGSMPVLEILSKRINLGIVKHELIETFLIG